MTAENQVVDAELDEPEAVTETTEERDSDRPALAESAPQCAGCHRRGIELTLLENGKRYCERCAQEVERLMGIGPLFPVAAEFIAEASEGHLSSTDGDPWSDGAEADIAPAAALIATEVDDGAEADIAPAAALIATEVDDGADTEAPEVADAPPASIDVAFEAEVAIEEHSEPSELPAPATVVEPIQVAPTAASETEAAPPAEAELTTIEARAAPEVAPGLEDEPERFTGLGALVAGANHDAASSSNSQIPRPTASQQTAAEEPPLMERVQEQTRPTRLETPAPAPSPAPAPAAPASDLAGVLAAERARLLDQRELLEAQFRKDVEAIDERLVHVESLLSDERVALAS